jgi:hypothetical protein
MRVTPSFFHLWLFGDPVLFCQGFLASSQIPGLTSVDPLPHPREVSNRIFSRRGRRSPRFTNDLHTYFGQFMTIDMVQSLRDEAESGIYVVC